MLRLLLLPLSTGPRTSTSDQGTHTHTLWSVPPPCETEGKGRHGRPTDRPSPPCPLVPCSTRRRDGGGGGREFAKYVRFRSFSVCVSGSLWGMRELNASQVLFPTPPTTILLFCTWSEELHVGGREKRRGIERGRKCLSASSAFLLPRFGGGSPRPKGRPEAEAEAASSIARRRQSRRRRSLRGLAAQIWVPCRVRKWRVGGLYPWL